MWAEPGALQRLSMGNQRMRLLQAFPNAQVRWAQGRLQWFGYLQPTLMSPRYFIRIDMTLQHPPWVYVLAPHLDLHPDHRKLPHTYLAVYLCLYDPKLNQWNHAMPIAETTIPWTAVWLFHYENWLSTGVWDATQSHPSPERAQRDGLAA